MFFRYNLLYFERLITKKMELLNTHPIKKSDLGFHGNLFGGKLLSWIDSAAAGYAMQLCDTPRMVTVSIDKCFFEKPAREGQLLKVYGSPSHVGNTSVDLYMEARSHNVYTGRQTLILKTNIRFVRIDEDGNPVPISERAKIRIEKIINGEETIDDKTI
jgi:acyl-CoA thioesterase YciA